MNDRVVRKTRRVRVRSQDTDDAEFELELGSPPMMELEMAFATSQLGRVAASSSERLHDDEGDSPKLRPRRAKFTPWRRSSRLNRDDERQRCKVCGSTPRLHARHIFCLGVATFLAGLLVTSDELELPSFIIEPTQAAAQPSASAPALPPPPPNPPHAAEPQPSALPAPPPSPPAAPPPSTSPQPPPPPEPPHGSPLAPPPLPAQPSPSPAPQPPPQPAQPAPPSAPHPLCPIFAYSIFAHVLFARKACPTHLRFDEHEPLGVVSVLSFGKW